MAADAPVPLADPKRQYLALEPQIRAAIDSVLQSGRYILGPQHDAFEAEFAAYCGVRFCIATANGTDALELALRAAGAGPGDEVIVAANGGMYSTIATNLVGAMPVFADVDRSLTLSPRAVAAQVTERTKAIIVTHLYGKLGDVEGIGKAIEASRQKPTIIEDCAQAHGAERGGRRAGSFGDLATFSFYPTKNLGAIGDAGAVVTSDVALAESVRRLRQYGWESRYRSVVPRGRNSRMDELQAAILRVKLRALDEGNAVRRAIVARYHDAYRGRDMTFVHAPEPDYVAHLCVVRHPERQKLRDQLAQLGVSTDIHYPTNDYRQTAMASIPWRAGPLTETEMAEREIVTIPCFAEMREAEIDRVSSALARLG